MAPDTWRPLNPGALIEAAEASGLSDGEIGELLARWFPDSLLPSWGPSFNPTPNSDGWRVRSVDLDRIGGYAETLSEQPTDAEIDESNARAIERRQQMRLVDERGGGM